MLEIKGRKGVKPVKVILDTDMGPDCDDAGAMAVLHALADLGEAEILGVVHCTSSKWGAGCIDAINRFYSRPDIPVGTLKEPGFLDDEGFCKYNRYIAENYENSYLDREAEDATALYRKILSSQADKSVIIIAIGPMKNLAKLLKSKADEYSGHDGISLVNRKVDRLVAMAGYFPEKGEEIYIGGTKLEAEWNIAMDIASADFVMEYWPTPVVFSGFEIGYRIKTGLNLQKYGRPENPVKKAYELYISDGYRESWDLTAVLYGVRGAGEYWDESPKGAIKIDREGRTVFHESSSKMHSYLLRKMSVADLKDEFEDLMSRPPAQGQKSEISMKHGERFIKIFNYEQVDRMPVYFFGSWPETKQRWIAEGYPGGLDQRQLNDNAGPQVEGMDPEWELYMWGGHDIIYNHAMGDIPYQELARDENTVTYRDSLGAIVKDSTGGETILHIIEPALKPTRESWEHFKRFLDPYDLKRFPEGWEEKAKDYFASDILHVMKGASLYGELRNWMGLEQISYLFYDDPDLMKEMIGYMAWFSTELYKPLFEKGYVPDVMYLYEDCCGSNGPLFSPDLFNEFFHESYRKLVAFYKQNGVKLVMLDSDGVVEKLIPYWLDSGIDILFPIEIGTWQADPVELRHKFGKRLKMFGGINKHLISVGGKELEEHLERLVPIVREGGFVPIADHRISPECSYEKFLDYIRTYKRIFML